MAKKNTDMSLLFKTLQIDTQMKVHKINVNTY